MMGIKAFFDKRKVTYAKRHKKLMDLFGHNIKKNEALLFISMKSNVLMTTRNILINSGDTNSIVPVSSLYGMEASKNKSARTGKIIVYEKSGQAILISLPFDEVDEFVKAWAKIPS